MRWALSVVLLVGCTFGGGSGVDADPPANSVGSPSVGSSGSTSAATGAEGVEPTSSPDGTSSPGVDSGGPPASGTTDGGEDGTTETPPSGSSTGTALPSGLIVDDLVVRYFLDEQSRGVPMNGAQIIDYGPGAPMDLTVVVQGSEPYYATADDNAGLRWDGVNSYGRPSATLVGSKLAALDGTTELTIEFVAAVDEVHVEGTRFVHAGFGATQHSFSVASRSTQMIELRTADALQQAVWSVGLSSDRAVYTVVIDLNRQSDPFLLFVDGVAYQPSQAEPAPALLSVTASHNLTLGNRDNGDRSLDGTLMYAAIYHRALSEAEIEHNVALLTDLDDQP